MSQRYHFKSIITTDNPIKVTLRYTVMRILTIGIIALFMLLPLGCGGNSSVPSTFLFQVYVGDNFGEDITNAEVELQLPDIPLIKKVTNGDGIAVYELDTIYQESLADITVEAQGYSKFTTTIKIKNNTGFPVKILLEPK